MGVLAELCGRYPEICHSGASLAERTSVRVGGRAELLVQPRHREELQRVVTSLVARGVPIFVLGGGSNLLVGDDGIQGAAVLDQRHLKGMCFDGPTARVEAGAPLARFIWTACSKGLAGPDGLVGIPGTVGGATFMNAGGHQIELGELVTAVEVLDLNGRFHTLSGSALEFSYRRSNLQGFIVVATHFAFESAPPEEVRVRAETILARKRATQPLKEKSSGCVFKNPPGDSAGRLIEAAGLKGEQIGGARVSTRHANFIVNTGKARASDIFALIERVRHRVWKTFDITLQMEVQRPARRLLERAG